MSQQDDMKANVEAIAKGLRSMGANRVVALSVHKSKELVAELEERTAKLLEQLEASS